jgi:isoaspartyl peptidase/L-asparaginase-like protein (Ntn-hydrolase superfamily)
MHGIIATWRMAKEGIEQGFEQLNQNGKASDAIETAIKAVEDFPYYKSVGYGGLPNEDQVVELDAGYMDGDTFDVGAICAIKDFANPISIAKKLSEEKVNNILVSYGAEKYAREHHFEEKEMLTDRAKAFYRKKKKELEQQAQELKPYDGHDTVGMVCLDENGTVVAGTSTSGLFMKKPGRVGDSPFVGSGFYADSEVGGATATGLGEDLMKGCISYEIVRLMKEGLTPQEACEKAVNDLDASLKKRRTVAGDLSVVAMNNKGEFGCATNIDGFSFSVATSDVEPTVYLVTRQGDGHCIFEVASKEWLDEYMRVRMAPVEE